MKLYEYQGKELFAKAGIPVPQGKTVKTLEELEEIKGSFGEKLVLKAQVHVGGRGKAGGIKVTSPENAIEEAKKILGKELKGLMVRTLLVEKAIDIEKEFYLGIIQDRAKKGITMMASSMGGIDIEQVAAEHPDKIIKVTVDPVFGIKDFHVKELVYGAGFPAELRAKAADFVKKLYKVYVENDCSLAEINPLVITKQGDVLAADSKVDMDDNADFRHLEWESMRDLDDKDKLELEAKSNGLSYIELEGDIGCVVNGAGLAMATMDVIKYFGGQPANFLDIGGSSNPEKVMVAMNILTQKPIKAILFNIFGGITRCDDIAKGLIMAFDKLDIKVPVFIRLTGTNQDIAKEIMEKAGYKVNSSMEVVIKEVTDYVKSL